METNIQTIYLGGGCFWCLEAVFQKVKGVVRVTSGYAGGNKDNPTYEEVSSGDTNHAEVTEIVFDTNIISLETILDIFFEIHDPTTLNRQGNDVGSQYRSIILVTSPDQLAASLKKLSEINSSGKYKSPATTEIKKLDKFFIAESYHQNFYLQNMDYPYCRIIIDPKLNKFINHHQELIR